jgi:uridine phosphorylase
MDVGPGDVANRVLTVGAVQRAEKIAAFFDTRTSVVSSSRGFTTITGTYKGVTISIVSIGMGPAMMDFFIRESRFVTSGPMAIVRFGTCGGISPAALPGTVVVARHSGYVNRNPNAFGKDKKDADRVEPYVMYEETPADIAFGNIIVDKLIGGIGAAAVVEGTNITAESFYSSQGRVDSDNFDDRNETLVDKVIAKYPSAASMEMESFQLLHLANCSKIPIYASAAAIVISNRLDPSRIVAGDVLDHLESEGGRDMLEALADFEFPK